MIRRRPRQQSSALSTKLYSAVPKSNGAAQPKRHNGRIRLEETAASKQLRSKQYQSTTAIRDHEQKKLASSSSSSSSPRHVAFVCDGNSRWAKQRGFPAAVGHAAGADRLVQVLKLLQGHPTISYCTFFGFSTENWQRPASEINDVWSVMEQTVKQFSHELLQEHVVLKVVGDLSDERIPASLRRRLQKLEQETTENCKRNSLQDANAAPPELTICLAINYGGRHDIVQATQRLAQLVAQGELDANDITEEMISQHLSTTDIPDPDLIIRTSGERRLSNFLLWNAAYAELFFVDTLWPDFDAQSLKTSLDWFSQRQRRFGGRQKENSGPGDGG